MANNSRDMRSQQKPKPITELLSCRADLLRNGATIPGQKNNDSIIKAVPSKSVHNYFARLGYREK